jgi:hypothetical protein
MAVSPDGWTRVSRRSRRLTERRPSDEKVLRHGLPSLRNLRRRRLGIIPDVCLRLQRASEQGSSICPTELSFRKWPESATSQSLHQRRIGQLR